MGVPSGPRPSVPADRDGVRVAVTGGSGFLGRRVVHRLAEVGARTVLLVRPGSTPPEGHLIERSLEVDFDAPPADLYEQAGRPQVLVHLSWSSLDDPSSPDHEAVELPRNAEVARTLIRPGLERVIATGTSLEYGMVHGPVAETTPAAPTTAYGRAKVALHAELRARCDEVDATLVWARVFPLLGHDQPDRELLGRLRTAVQQQQPIFEMSLGEQLRDYLPVEDAGAIVADLALDERAEGIYNVCSGEPISIRRLAEEWCEQHGSPITLRFGRRPLPTHESIAYWGDRTRLDVLTASDAAGRQEHPD